MTSISKDIHDITRYNVLGIGVSALNLSTAVTAVMDALEHRKKGYICVTGVHGVSEAQSDPDLQHILNRSFLNTPDGMPLVWLGRHHIGKEVDRVYGPDLMLRVCAATENTPYRHFLYGGAPGVAEDLETALKQKFPKLKITGHYCPPFRPLNPEEEEALAVMVDEARPDIIWVGLSTPKQEKFMSKYINKLDTTLMFGVGAAFDFHTGRVSQAPQWMQRCGLEWFFRLCCEPRRLWKRYLKNNPLFILRILAQITGLKKYPLHL